MSSRINNLSNSQFSKDIEKSSHLASVDQQTELSNGSAPSRVAKVMIQAKRYFAQAVSNFQKTLNQRETLISLNRVLKTLKTDFIDSEFVKQNKEILQKECDRFKPLEKVQEDNQEEIFKLREKKHFLKESIEEEEKQLQILKDNSQTTQEKGNKLKKEIKKIKKYISRIKSQYRRRIRCRHEKKISGVFKRKANRGCHRDICEQLDDYYSEKELPLYEYQKKLAVYSKQLTDVEKVYQNVILKINELEKSLDDKKKQLLFCKNNLHDCYDYVEMLNDKLTQLSPNNLSRSHSDTKLYGRGQPTQMDFSFYFNQKFGVRPMKKTKVSLLSRLKPLLEQKLQRLWNKKIKNLLRQRDKLFSENLKLKNHLVSSIEKPIKEDQNSSYRKDNLDKFLNILKLLKTQIKKFELDITVMTQLSEKASSVQKQKYMNRAKESKSSKEELEEVAERLHLYLKNQKIECKNTEHKTTRQIIDINGDPIEHIKYTEFDFVKKDSTISMRFHPFLYEVKDGKFVKNGKKIQYSAWELKLGNTPRSFILAPNKPNESLEASIIVLIHEFTKHVPVSTSGIRKVYLKMVKRKYNKMVDKKKVVSIGDKTFCFKEREKIK